MSKETATTNTIINSQALKSIMQLEGKTTADIAAALNITRKHAEKKITGRAGWYAYQAGRIADMLHMTDRGINIVFFPDYAPAQRDSNFSPLSFLNDGAPASIAK